MGSASCSMCERSHYLVRGVNEVNGYILDGVCHKKSDGVDDTEPGTTLETLDLRGGFFRFSLAASEVYPCPIPENW